MKDKRYKEGIQILKTWVKMYNTLIPTLSLKEDIITHFLGLVQN